MYKGWVEEIFNKQRDILRVCDSFEDKLFYYVVLKVGLLEVFVTCDGFQQLPKPQSVNL
jgi:hypothetical protein